MDIHAHSALWRRTLAPIKNDQFSEARTLLRESYLGARKNAAELVKLIPQDCKSITVHDITHLDALWEMADLICGPDFPVNPAEAFVFGMAVLVHDAGMALAAYPDGMPGIAQTTEWLDTVYALYRKRGLAEPSRDAIHNPPPLFKEEILFNVLRALHAKQAEDLVSLQWKIPGTTEQVRVLENQHLRVSYAKSIGRIAHSHHWSIERVASELRSAVGAATELPLEWKVNEIKVACMLRCADAAHIDHRRAPSMLYALSKPKGASDKHWSFQHKITKPTPHSGALLYSSGQDFDLDEAQAWWLCFDTIRMINHELSSSNALLQDIDDISFALSRVYGAESPRILSRHIRPNGWQPVDAEITVSDPAALAETLGGKRLYGRGAFAPIRELLQNAADAIRARRRLENRGPAWGKIRIVLETTGSDVWLHVDDTGVGMSERVLVGPLLDFGRSLWNSPILHEEFPGLESRGIKPIGKFGIGFFSVFLLGSHVKVITRPYTAGFEDTRVLEFSSIATRPILRSAKATELPTDFSTRISVRIESLKDLSDIRERGRLALPQREMTIHETIRESVRHLIAALDITVEVHDEIAKHSYVHGSDWSTVPATKFLDEILSATPEAPKEVVIGLHERLVCSVESSAGDICGRAALWMYSDERKYQDPFTYAHTLANVSVGGFLYPMSRFNFHFLGVLTGDTEDVARKSAAAEVPDDALAIWASRQAELIDPSRFRIYDVIRACHTIVRLNGNPKDLPFCFSGGMFRTLKEFEAIAAAAKHIHLPISKSYEENFEWLKLQEIGPMFFIHDPIPELIVVQLDTGLGLFKEGVGREILEHGDRDIDEGELGKSGLGEQASLIADRLEELWSCKLRLRVGAVQAFSEKLYQPPSKRWVLSILRNS